MHPLAVGKNYCLRLSDGRALGHVRIERLEDPWAEGPFTPATAFAEFRQLFEREAELRKDQIIPLWEQAADAIEALGIQVIEEGGGSIHPGFRVFVEGDRAFVGTPLPVA
jgi:hypothetical protein